MVLMWIVAGLSACGTSGLLKLVTSERERDLSAHLLKDDDKLTNYYKTHKVDTADDTRGSAVADINQAVPSGHQNTTAGKDAFAQSMKYTPSTGSTFEQQMRYVPAQDAAATSDTYERTIDLETGPIIAFDIDILPHNSK